MPETCASVIRGSEEELDIRRRVNNFIDTFKHPVEYEYKIRAGLLVIEFHKPPKDFDIIKTRDRITKIRNRWMDKHFLKL